MIGVHTPFELPTRIPIFPLSGTVLMPFGHLPLNIFEPRYVNLIDDALGAGRTFGMIQPRTPHIDPIPDDAELYDVGTIGRLIQFHETGDGRYVITLQGVSRFRVLRTDSDQTNSDLSDRGYRWAQVDYDDFLYDLDPADHEDGPGRARILELMRGYFVDKAIEADWDAVCEAPYEALVASLAMSCPFEPEEKQALLECETHEDRASMLISLFEMSGTEAGPDTSPLKH